LIDIPQVISNLQANSAYWRELAEAKLTEDLLNLVACKQAASSENADIIEDNENEEQKESTHEADPNAKSV
jgi:hypothetical protein